MQLRCNTCTVLWCVGLKSRVGSDGGVQVVVRHDDAVHFLPSLPPQQVRGGVVATDVSDVRLFSGSSLPCYLLVHSHKSAY